MSNHILSGESIDAFTVYLKNEERAPGTVEKYLRDVRTFTVWLNGKPVTKEAVTEWKEHLLSQHYTPSAINATLAALNGLFHCLG